MHTLIFSRPLLLALLFSTVSLFGEQQSYIPYSSSTFGYYLLRKKEFIVWDRKSDLQFSPSLSPLSYWSILLEMQSLRIEELTAHIKSNCEYLLIINKQSNILSRLQIVQMDSAYSMISESQLPQSPFPLTLVSRVAECWLRGGGQGDTNRVEILNLKGKPQVCK